MPSLEKHPKHSEGNGFTQVKYKGSKLYWKHQMEYCEFYAKWGHVALDWPIGVDDTYVAMCIRHGNERRTAGLTK